MAPQGKRRFLNRAAILIGLWLACFGLLGILSDLRQASRPAPELPGWARGEAAQAAPLLSSTVTLEPVGAEQAEGMLPAILPEIGSPEPGEPPVERSSEAGRSEPSVETGPAATPHPAEEPGRLVIPRLELDAPVLAVAPETITLEGVSYQQWSAPDQFAAGWHDRSARLGEGGNTVLSGHHNIDGSVFARLVDLEEGDRILVYGEKYAFIYRVIERLILPERDQPVEVRLENARWIGPSEDERLTLITCWPEDSNTHRLIVVAEPLSVDRIPDDPGGGPQRR